MTGRALGTHRRAKLMWQVKHLKGLTFVSEARVGQQATRIGRGENVRVRMCLSRCSSLVKDWPQYVQKTMLGELDRVG